ncbi:MAG TPA: formimidoylglutamate deiminase [Solirubrobacteraceae bacterium]|nr:formimidoylglutamate deiminase [Solirubrobacteraceae bacterium]
MCSDAPRGDARAAAGVDGGPGGGLTIEAAHLLLPTGWASPGHLTVDGSGTIVSAGGGRAAAAGRRLDGYVVPGMANVHSHAHHRGLVGWADRLRAGSPATLWTWRRTMYGHLREIEPDQLQAYATLAYVEMLRRGYTSVGEFHYLHNAPDGSRYADPAEMSRRILAAARTAGIAITLLPALYTRGGIDREPEGEQRRFVSTAEEYLTLLCALDGAARADPLVRVGAAPHSLRAVRPAELASVVEARPSGPMHIHAAERTEEVAEVAEALGAPPVAWLLANVPLDPRWCVIHATHMTASERHRLAVSGAVAGVCPLTEANLADGRFPLAAYRRAGGRIAVGTDANHSVDLAGELRMLEYGQRLHSRRRETLLRDGELSVGAVLHGLALAGGAQALAQPCGAIAPGLRCDLVELDPDHPALAGQEPETVLDAWIFSSSSDAIVRTVLVGGREVVSAARHAAQEPARQRVDGVMRLLHGRR